MAAVRRIVVLALVVVALCAAAVAGMATASVVTAAPDKHARQNPTGPTHRIGDRRFVISHVAQ